VQHNSRDKMNDIIQDIQWYTSNDTEVDKIKSVFPELDQYYFDEKNDKSVIGLPNNRILTYRGLNFNQFINIRQLYCWGNQLTPISSSLVNLTHWYCRYNKLTSIPSSLVNLTHLNCSYNKLTSIPSSLVNLTHLNCSYNQLTSIPSSLVNLTHLHCWSNQLTSIPSSLVNLTELDCDLEVIIPYNLKQLMS
jgi:Leucine-rich repeat (LRR) protein